MTTEPSVVRVSVVHYPCSVKGVAVHDACSKNRSPYAELGMPSIHKNNRAAALLAELRDEDRLSTARLALLIGVTPDELRACRDHSLVLAPVAQAKLGRAIAARVPRLAIRARRLEEQATAAALLESRATTIHLTAPAKWLASR